MSVRLSGTRECHFAHAHVYSSLTQANPTVMTHEADPPNEPEVLMAEWDLPKVLTLFDDLERGAEVKHVQARSSMGKSTNDTSVSLGEAKQMLSDGSAKAIQIYYDFEQQSWCDTLMVLPDCIRVIRAVGHTWGGTA